MVVEKNNNKDERKKMLEERLMEKIIDWFSDNMVMTQSEFDDLYIETEEEEITTLNEDLQELDEETNIESIKEYKE